MAAFINAMTAGILWMSYRDRSGKRIRESTFTEDWDKAQRKLRERLQARDDRILDIVRKGEHFRFADWVEFFLENYSQPPIRAHRTHEANLRCSAHLKKTFEDRNLGDLTADDVELYLRRRLQDRVPVRTAAGVVQRGRLKPATVHQELRVLRRMLNVAVRKKLLPANPCLGVEFPVKVNGLFRPHYMSWSEQQRVELQAPEYLQNIIRIITETGLPHIQGAAADEKGSGGTLDNAVVWIADSKTPNGISEVPLTNVALEAFRGQIRISGPGPWLFPSHNNPSTHQKTLKTVWHAVLRRAKVPYFRIYDLRSTYATRFERRRSGGRVGDPASSSRGRGKCSRNIRK